MVRYLTELMKEIDHVTREKRLPTNLNEALMQNSDVLQIPSV